MKRYKITNAEINLILKNNIKNKMKLIEVDILKEMVMHMAFTKIHHLKNKYTIEKKGHILHNRVFYSETHTEKKNDFEYGKSETTYYWTNKSEPYNNIVDFLKNLGLKLKNGKAKKSKKGKADN